MSHEVKTAVFEGPLEVLLELVSRRQVEISELSLIDLVVDYLSGLEAMGDFDLEADSRFLLIASTLVQLKARRLLPEDRQPDLDEELAVLEERDRLLAGLLACATFRDVAAVLAHRLAYSERFKARQGGMDADLPVRPAEVRIDLDPQGLARLATRVLRGPESPDLDHLDLELPSVRDALVDLRSRVMGAVEADFAQLTAHCARKVEVAAYFLAMLELARWGLVDVRQNDWSSAIRVRHRQNGVVDLRASEWGP